MSTAPTVETVADALLREAYTAGSADIFNAPAGGELPEGERLELLKSAGDLLVRARLATFADDGRTLLMLTNAGRYWALHDGFLGFLKEEPAGAASSGGRQRNPEMEALRSEYRKLRLNTFWWSFGLSIAGFVMSIVSVIIAMFYGQRLLP